MESIDVLNDFVSFIDAEWDTVNVAPKPRIVKEWDVRAMQLASFDYVIVKVIDEDIRTFINAAEWQHVIPLVIEVRTSKSDSRMDDLVDEVFRILKNNVRRNGYAWIVTRSMKDLTNVDNSRKLWRAIIEVEAAKFT